MEKRNTFAPMKVGVIFGGSSRDRESSFRAGREICDSLDKALFTAVPVFADSLGNYMLLDWLYLYKNSIREFYPPAEAIPDSVHAFPVYIESLGELTPEHQEEIMRRVGRPLVPQEFKNYFDFALLALPEPLGKNENLPALLDLYQIPFFGASHLSPATDPDFLTPQQMVAHVGFSRLPYWTISVSDWAPAGHRLGIYQSLKEELGLPLVLKTQHQSTVTENLILEEDDFEAFVSAVEHTFLSRTLYKTEWQTLSEEEQLELIKNLSDIKAGIGMPVRTENGTVIHHPEQLLGVIKHLFNQPEPQQLTLTQLNNEPVVVVEALVKGQAFSCMVMQPANGTPLALQPVTPISQEAGDQEPLFAAKNKLRQLNCPPPDLHRIRQACQRLFTVMGIKVLAQVQGLLADDGQIFLTGLNPAFSAAPFGYFPGQAAQIGFNATHFLNYIMLSSLAEPGPAGAHPAQPATLWQDLKAAFTIRQATRHQKTKVAVLMGDGGEDPDKFLTGGREVFLQLAASGKYQPQPIFFTGSVAHPKMYLLPLALLELGKVTAIKKKLFPAENSPAWLPAQPEVLDDAGELTATYAGTMLRQPQPVTYDQLRNLVDIIFIQAATDGGLQAELEKHRLPYTGSGLSTWKNILPPTEIANLLGSHGLTFNAGSILAGEANGTPAPVTVAGSIITRYLPDGRLGYEILFSPSSVVTGEDEPGNIKILTGEIQQMVSDDEGNNSGPKGSIADKVKAAFVTTAQVLNMEGYARMEALVRSREHTEAEILIAKVDLQPNLRSAAPIFTEAAVYGLKPFDLLDRILRFSLERHKLKEG